MSATNNIFADLPQSDLPEEIIQILHNSTDISIKKIISTGQISPPGFWYDQPRNEWVIVLKGNAVIEFAEGNRLHKMQKGDFLFIPAHQKHRVNYTSTHEVTVWLAVFFN